jgi:flagellar export protein FliJ
MKPSLDRLLRLRSLLEGVSRVELEARVQELARIERAIEHLRESGRAMRQLTFSGIAQSRDAQRLEAEAMGEWVAQERGTFERARQDKGKEVDTAKAEYLERRKESRQVGILMESKAAAGAMERSRREQREMDDWFAQRMRASRRTANRPL